MKGYSLDQRDTENPEEWLDLWGPSGSKFNCSTLTFDMGCLSDQCRDLYVAVSEHVSFIQPEDSLKVREF